MKYLTIFVLALLGLAALLAVLIYEEGLPKELVDERWSSPASQFMDLGERGRIHFRDQGQPEGLPLLLIHGSNASLHAYEPWVQRLGDGYRLVSLDLPGHGLTGETPNADYSIGAYVSVVEALRAHLRLPPFVLVGSSMGGAVALRYTFAYPGNVRALALVASGGVEVPQAEAEEGAPGDTPLIFQLLQEPWFQAIAAKVDTGWLLDQGLASAYSNASAITPELRQRYYDLNMRQGTRAATVKRFQQGRRSLPEESIAAIRVPALIMWGERDSLTPFAMALRLKELLPQAQTAFYKRVGHLPMEEIPNLSADDLRSFLQRLPGGAAARAQ